MKEISPTVRSVKRVKIVVEFSARRVETDWLLGRLPPEH